MSTQGSDQFGTGSSTQPYMTVTKGISVANPGNLISVANGSYAEIGTFTSKSGLNACHIVLQSANPQGAILAGARLTSSNFVDIQNFKFTNQTAATPAGYGVYISGTSHDDTVTGNLITQLCHEGIYEEPTVGTNILLSLNTISYAQMSGLNIDGSGTTASFNDISQTQQRPKAVGGIYSVCQAFSPGNDDADWIRVFHSGHRILNNNLHDIPHGTVANPLDANEPHTDCFQSFGSTMTNSVFNANTCIGSDPASHTTWDEEVSSFEGTVTGNTFENNVFANLHQGFELDGAPQSGNHYYNNTFDHMTLEALVYGTSNSSEVVENNEFYDVGNGGDGPIGCFSATPPTWTTNNATMRSGSVGTFCGSCTCPSSTTLAPGFLNAGTINGTGADYHLCLGNNSPAGSSCTALSSLADVATTIASFQTDHDGVSRPQGSGWSIGAYEQVPLPSTATPTPTASPSPTPIPQTLLITSPTNGSTVRVTTTVLDTNSNSKCGGLSWYDELWIDGVHTVDGGFSSTAFNPATHLGSHTLQIYAHTINQQGGPQGFDCDSSNIVTVTGATPTPTPTPSPTATGRTPTPTPSPTPVPSATPTGSTQFQTLPPGASLPSGSFCASAATALNIPEHASYNHDDGSPAHWNSLLPPASIPSYYHANAPGGSEMPNSDFNLVDGNYTGTTEDTFAWASCKWGILLDVIRAQAETESGGWHGDCPAIHGGSATNCPEAGDYDSPAGNNCGLPVTSITAGGCFTALNGLGACRVNGVSTAMTGNHHCASWNVIQTKDWYQWMTYPMNTVSLPFGVDHRYAEMRGCMNGDQFSYFHSQNVDSGADYQNSVNLAKSNPSGLAPTATCAAGKVTTNCHTIPLDLSGETNLQYLQWKCDGTHFSGGWTTAMNGYLTTTLGHYNSHDWPGGLHGNPATPTPTATPTTLASTLNLTSANNGQTFNNYRISTTSGPCLKMTNASNITIQNSNIGPCGQDNSDNDSNGIEISGGSGHKIYDSYIHVENRGLQHGFSQTRSHNGIEGINAATNVTIQGNVICYGAANVRPLDASNGWVVNGNFLCNPRGYDGTHNQFQSGSSNNQLVENNYMLSCQQGPVTDWGQSTVTPYDPVCPSSPVYLFTEGTEDNVNFFDNAEIAEPAGTVTGNYIAGGGWDSGTGIIADQAADGLTITNNTVVEVGGAGIAHASGKDWLVTGNKAWSNNAAPSADIVASYDNWGYLSFAFGPCVWQNNILTTHRGNVDNNYYWNGNGTHCSSLAGYIFSGNTTGAAADTALGLNSTMTAAQVMAIIPPPLIPPVPKNCVVKSPYSTQTSLPSCP